MSVRVNLLPGEVAERNRAARQRAALGVAGLGVLGLLAAVYVVQIGRVNDARSALEAQQAAVAEKEGEVAELEEFGLLEQRATEAGLILSAALGDEASLAGVLQDLAAVFPADAELSTLAITLPEAGPQTAELGGIRPVYGTMNATGRTLRGHAPGLERLLLELDKVATFADVFFSTSTVDEAGVSTFSLEVNLGEEILTGRYVDGLPEELR